MRGAGGLRLLRAAGAAVGLLAAGRGLEAAAPPPAAFTVAAADALLAKLPAGDPWVARPDGSTLAWGESHLLHALVDLFEATGEVRYLEEVARRGDRLLAHRDDRRGVVDGSGRSRPAWSMADKYVVAAGTLVDAEGRPALRLRSVPTSHNNFTEVEVVAEAAPGRFTLHVGNEHFRRSEEFRDLAVAAGDARFVEPAVNARTAGRGTRAGTFSDESRLVRVTVVPAGGMPRPQRVRLAPIPLAYTGYLGVIYHPLLRFAECVRADGRAAPLAAAATRFVQAAEESYADADRRVWRDGPGDGEGYYLTCERGESFPYDNVGQPFNFLGRHTASLLALRRLTGQERYAERAARMVRLFQRRLRHEAARDLYVWNYWYEPVTTTGWRRADGPSDNVPDFTPVATVEDVSHGVLDIVMVTAARAAGLAFDDRDLQRFGRTLLRNVLNETRTGVNLRVDGSGGAAPAYLPALGGWLELARYNPEILREIRRTAEAAGVTDLGVVTAVLKWERVLAGRGR